MEKICKASWIFRKLKAIPIFHKKRIVKLLNKIKTYFIGYLLELSKPIVIITGIGVYLALYNYSNNNNREKDTATIEYFNGFYDILETTDKTLLDTINFYGFKGKNYILGSDTLENILNDNPTYEIQLYKLMSFLNLYAIGCQENIFEEKTAWAAYYSIITQSTKSLIPYFEILEKKRGHEGVCWFMRNMVRRWEIDTTFPNEFNQKIKKLNYETEEMIKKCHSKNKNTIILR